MADTPRKRKQNFTVSKAQQKQQPKQNKGQSKPPPNIRRR